MSHDIVNQQQYSIMVGMILLSVCIFPLVSIFVSGDKLSPRNLDEPNILNLTSHNTTCVWDFSSTIEYNMTNVTKTQNGTELDIDRETYTGLPSTIVNSITSIESYPDVVCDVKGDFIVAYSNGDLYAQKVDAHGYKIGNEFLICGGNYIQRQPDMSIDSDNNLVITWAEHIDSTNSDIYYSKYDDNGTRIGNIITVANTSKYECIPQIVTDADNNVIIGWVDGDGDIHAQKFNGSGNRIGSELDICNAPGAQGVLKIALDSKNNLYSVWGDLRTGIGEIYMKRFYPNMTQIEEEILVASTKFFAAPAIAIDSKDNFYVAWQGTYEINDDIHAQKFNSSASPIGDELIVCNSSKDQTRPNLVMDSNDNLFISWEDQREYPESDLYGRWVSSNGAFTGQEFLISQGDESCYNPSVAINLNNDIMITYVGIPTNTNIPHNFYIIPYIKTHYYGAGIITTSDFTAANLYSWSNLTSNWYAKNVGSNNIWFNYSLDSGMSWTSVPENGSLSNISRDNNTIRLRIDFNTLDPLSSPVLQNVSINYTDNKKPVTSVPKDILGYRHQKIKLNGSTVDDDNDILRYEWLQISGLPVQMVDDRTENMSFVPFFSGNYSFQLAVFDGYDENLSAIVNVEIKNRAPIVDAGIDQFTWKGTLVRLKASGIDPDGDSLSYVWEQVSGPDLNIPDLFNQTIQFNPTLVGNYSFNVVVNDSEANSSVDLVNVTVWSRPPIASFTATPTPCQIRQNVTFNASQSSDSDGNITGYYFDFGDKMNSGWILSPLAIHAYQIAGIYSISLVVRDDDGNISEAARVTMTVQGKSTLHPSFRIKDGNLSIPYEFFSTSTIDNGTIVSFGWDFGDGERGIGINATHQYKRSGTYNITLLVTDDRGDTAFCQTQLTINDNPVNLPPFISKFDPLNDFTIEVGKNKLLSIVAFDPENKSLSYIWYINNVRLDGIQTNAFSFKPKNAGTNVVKVVVEDEKGEKAEHMWNITATSKSETPDNKSNFNYTLIIPIIIIIVILLIIISFIIKKKQRISK